LVPFAKSRSVHLAACVVCILCLQIRVCVCVCVGSKGLHDERLGLPLASGCKMIFLGVRDRGNLTFVRGLAENSVSFIGLEFEQGEGAFPRKFVDTHTAVLQTS
jgi:hypothetical protein